ncbi:MAG: metalloregulator ArsR/SmtB family transcription factor [Caulobacteraceae bacterium]|nr:metalloregulator ArsR/SmtB family transcription factor [Caulobacteraceae bacterium]
MTNNGFAVESEVQRIGGVRIMDMAVVMMGFSALSTVSRVEILRLLAKEAPPEGMKSGDIAKRLGVAQNTLSTQLMMLSHARLVQYQRDGRSILYRVDQENLQALSDFLLKECGGLPRARPTRKAA